ELAKLAVPAAEASRAALVASARAEALEDAGQKDSADWREAATAAARAQRDLKAAEARRGLLVAQQARGKAPAGPAGADKVAAAAAKALAQAAAAVAQPITTAYAKRPTKSYPATSTGRRLAFARWIASRDNPLAARVAVNHIWLRHFGQAIVPTVSD